jgi:peptidyl-prolyl cis-trans isomerase A (cyclophilin A)
MFRAVRPVAAIAVVVTLGAVTAFTRGQQAPAPHRDLTNPAAFTETAPATYQARFDTSAGTFTILVTRAWAPNSADRFYNLVKAGFYDECRFFRVVKDFVAQFGVHGDPAVQAAWNKALIPGDRPKMSNTRGRITFATARASSSRATQVFINFGDNSKKLDSEGFAPFGQVTSGMVMVDRMFSQYGEGPDPVKLLTGGNEFLLKSLPGLDYVKTATIKEAPGAPFVNTQGQTRR